MKRLATRPLPIPGESLTGYLLRLGKLNCIFQPSEILSVLGVEETSHVAKGWFQTASEDLFRALEERLERPALYHLKQFERQDGFLWQRDWTRLIQDVRMGYPRICTQCIAETGVMDWRWSLAFIATCPKHSSLLKAKCPNCKKALNSSGRLLVGCDKCERNWAAFEEPDASPISNQELQLWKQLELEPSGVDPTVIHDVCRAIVFMMRPFDSLHDTLKAAPRFVEHSEHVARAYQTLQEPGFFAQWRKQCHEKRKELLPMGQEFIEAPCKLFRDGLLNDWVGPADGEDIQLDSIELGDSLSENTCYIAQPRREAEFELEGGIGYRYQVDIESIASIKFWSEESVEDLVSEGIFPTFKDVKQSKKRRFDARQIIGRLREFILPTTDGYIEVDANAAVFQRNFANAGKLANDILRRVIRGGFSPENLLTKFYVDESQFRKWLVQQRMSATRRSVCVERVASALECTEHDVHKLVQEDRFKWATHREWQKWVDGPSLFEYMIRLD